MSRGSGITIGLAVFFGLAYLCGYNAGQKSVVVPPPPVCPQPKPEPERCMAWWFGKDVVTDKVALRRQICGQDSRASTPRR